MTTKSEEVIVAETALAMAALHWFSMHKPVVYTCEQHLKNPTINTCTPAEAALARQVAKLVELGELVYTEDQNGN